MFVTIDISWYQNILSNVWYLWVDFSFHKKDSMILPNKMKYNWRTKYQPEVHMRQRQQKEAQWECQKWTVEMDAQKILKNSKKILYRMHDNFFKVMGREMSLDSFKTNA